MIDLSQEATILVTTYNRKDDLEVCLESAVRQTGSPQVLVIDDASTDGTSEMVREKFPEVELIRVEVNKPLIPMRNRAADWVDTPIIVSLDDDAEFTCDDIVADIIHNFEDERIGVVAIPYEDVKVDPGVIHQKKPNKRGQYATSSFIGTAYAVRRDLFQEIGKFRDFYVRQGEERDLTLRLFREGYSVVLGDSGIIKHYASPRRDFRQVDVYGRRNDILFMWFFCPFPTILWHLPGAVVKGLIHGFRKKRLKNNFDGIWKGLLDLPSYWRLRNPVSNALYETYRQLRTEPIPLDELEEVIDRERQKTAKSSS